MVDQVYHHIHRFRELERKLKQDFWALRSMGISEVPDHTTFCHQIKQIEESLYARIYKEILDELEPNQEFAIGAQHPFDLFDTTKMPKKEKFHGYKFHAIVSEDLELSLNYATTSSSLVI